jgi:hypothetical protein
MFTISAKVPISSSKRPAGASTAEGNRSHGSARCWLPTPTATRPTPAAKAPSSTSPASHPKNSSGWHIASLVSVGTDPRLPILSHRGHRPVRCPGLSRPAQRRLRRRLVDHPEGRRGRGRLGPNRDAGPPGCATRHNLSACTLPSQIRNSTGVDLDRDVGPDPRRCATGACRSAGWSSTRRGRPLDNRRRFLTT